jgi:hypothetical protein
MDFLTSVLGGYTRSNPIFLNIASSSEKSCFATPSIPPIYNRISPIPAIFAFIAKTLKIHFRHTVQRGDQDRISVGFLSCLYKLLRRCLSAERHNLESGFPEGSAYYLGTVTWESTPTVPVMMVGILSILTGAVSVSLSRSVLSPKNHTLERAQKSLVDIE